MKLDKMRFAELIGYCANRGMTIDKADLEVMDSLIDVQADRLVGITAYQLAELLQKLSKSGFSKIEAIKLMRSYFGFSLKEAYDFVEQNFHFNLNEPATLGNILKKAVD